MYFKLYCYTDILVYIVLLW